MEKALIGLVGVLLGAILTVARELWNDHRTKKKRAEYLAIRVTCIIERFMDGCVSVVGDDGEMYGRDDQGCVQLQTTAPEIDFESLDVDWHSLPFDLMYEILNFPTYVEESNGIISSVFEYVAGPPDYDEGIEERIYQYSKLGLKAYDLSKKLRSKYQMPEKTFENWNPIEYLQEKQNKIEQLRKERNERINAQ